MNFPPQRLGDSGSRVNPRSRPWRTRVFSIATADGDRPQPKLRVQPSDRFPFIQANSPFECVWRREDLAGRATPHQRLCAAGWENRRVVTPADHFRASIIGQFDRFELGIDPRTARAARSELFAQYCFGGSREARRAGWVRLSRRQEGPVSGWEQGRVVRWHDAPGKSQGRFPIRPAADRNPNQTLTQFPGSSSTLIRGNRRGDTSPVTDWQSKNCD